ncbi:aldehyde dehydrogenase family protein [Micromonospora sp. CPCC 206061]|uniref:aldehyde dehydrogenase family protein n=1 Tax=Micromonospora sp. CPCC 206061 TaxID=3122410 RepID=UPI002FEE6AA7
MAVTEPPLSLLPPAGLLIGDDWHGSSSGGTVTHVYPASGQPTADVVVAGATEVGLAVTRAREALPAWRAMPANQRRDLMLRLAALIEAEAEPLSQLQTLEIGLPCQLTRQMPAVAADYFRYNAGWLDKIGGEVVTTWPVRALDYTLDEPYGVVAIIIPWNGPLVSLGQMLGAALAAGNTVVLKPPELAPFVALRIGGLMLAAGFPPGVVNVVPGGPAAGEALVGHPGVDKVHFTGGADTARSVLAAAARNLTPVALELGGKSPHLIFPDAELRLAARLAMAGAVALSGQGCANGTRVLVHASVYDEVVDIIAARMAKVAVGDPLDQRTIMGPVVSARACDRILAVIDRARTTKSGRLVHGGHRLDGDLAGGYFIAPTAFADVDPSSELAQEEIFGPVVSIMRFGNEAEALRLAEDTRYGLGAYLHTNDLRRAHRVSRALTAGTVWVNGEPGGLPSAPFGGTKQSGYGRIGGLAGVREFLRPKNIWMAV